LNFPVSNRLDLLVWQLRRAQNLRLVEGELESVVYNDCSGETHLLSAIAVSLLQHLKNGRADFSSISTFLADAWEFESDEDLRQTAHSLLGELDALGLIEVCPS
jgi:PqqD family protein of HPr-rel-A system